MKRFCSKSLYFVAIGCLISCTKNVEYQDLRVGDVEFSSLQASKYINQNQLPIETKVNMRGHFSNPEISLAVYESEDCSGEFEEQSQASFDQIVADSLADGKKYSFRLLITVDKKSYRSACTPWVGVDQQQPNPVTPVVPPSNGYTAQTSIQARWNPSVDIGISGLAELPYKIKLYDQTLCSGNVIQSIDTDSLLEEFAGLNHGVFYSFQVVAVDKAGNESPLTCSPSTEIDIYAPGLVLDNPTSDHGFSSTTTVGVTITNDSWAGYWCITENTSFQPNSPADACPGGQGPQNGWHTSAPTTYTLSNGEGLKDVRLWILNGDGDRRTDKSPSMPIEYDATAPAMFSVSGLTGEDDIIVDEFLADGVDPVVHWVASSGQKEYLVQILNLNTTMRCEATATMSLTQIEIENCSLVPGADYIVRMKATDYAGNVTFAPDFPFSVDLTPPGPFMMVGVTGATETLKDNWAPGVPHAYWTASADAVNYLISVRDMSNGLVCNEAMVADPNLDFNFNSGTCSALNNGQNYTVRIRSVDRAGLETPAGNSPYEFRVDSEVPSVTITGTPITITNITTAQFDFNVLDALSGLASVECDLNGGGYVACTTPQIYPALTQNTYLFSLRATDIVGNVNTQTHTFHVDLTPPTVTFTQQPGAYVSSTSTDFQFTAVDSGMAGVDHIECNIDNGGWFTCVSPFNIPVLPPGNHAFQVQASDTLGHMSSVITSNWMIDITGPSVTLTGMPPTGQTDTNATISFTSSDGESPVVSHQCQWDGGAWTACSSPDSRSGLSVGNHTVNVRATNAAGVTGTAATYSWVIYSYSWRTAGWVGCTAVQPSWQTGAWSGCSVGAPAYTYDGWGACSASCGGGVQYRNQYCPVVNGSDNRAVWCPTNSGTETRTVWCERNDGLTVTDGFCGGGKPPESQACSRNDCPGAAPTSSVACSRGGGSDCHSPQPTSNSCNTHACYTYGWAVDGFGGCDAPQPAYAYDAWYGCTASCNAGEGGTYSGDVYGTQYRNESCPVNWGNQYRNVWCQRSDGAAVGDGFCGGGKPGNSQGCTRGGGGDCHSQQATTSSCVINCGGGGGASCFTDETLIELADGRRVTIDKIRVGDKVRSAFGAINNVVSVEKVSLAGRKLFAFNGEKPFFTAEHPFLTLDGWKSLNPTATREEHGFVVDGRLGKGDLVLLHGQWIKIDSFNTQQEYTAKEVYNLILDGDHSYIANGYGVHNKH